MLIPKKKKRTGTQIILDLTKSAAGKVQILGKQNLPLNIVYTICILIFSFSIIFGLYGWGSRLGDISKKEQSVRNLKMELASLEKQLEESQEFKLKLINDSLTIEAIARSYGMSKKGEKIFYFLD